LAQGDLPKVMVGDLSEHLSLPDQILSGFDAHTRAFVQIQQGCDQGCTFCIIHVARGPSRSLAPTLIKRQVERLAMNGYPEIVICGVDLGSYGEDFKDLTESFDLVDLLEELLAIEYSLDNPFRIRLSSIDPHHITDRLIDLIAKHDRMCPQFHLSLQSGSTLILKRMKRRYDASHVRERIAAMRAQVPELVLSADVMVGFPTETEVEFSETLKMVEDINIAFPHVFSYSERDGTPAARIPSNKQVPVATRKHRNKRLRELGNELKDSLLRSKVNSHSWVLPEKPAKQAGFSLCRGEDYVEVLVPSEQVALGKWQKVLIKDYSDGLLIAE
jgi:threonylcarbamoyladenosine tRNA methylthiotransferase MtaB